MCRRVAVTDTENIVVLEEKGAIGTAMAVMRKREGDPATVAGEC